ncbi:MAG: hypothetical protein MZV63_55600 [Marinilabiliales bacterium]|nr:hypothetical protein [Marinilabiliales bacterium]
MHSTPAVPPGNSSTPFFSRALKPALPLAAASVLVILTLLVLRGKSYYTAGLFPFLVCAGAVFWRPVIKTRWVRVVLPVLLVILTIPAASNGDTHMEEAKLARFFSVVRENTGFLMRRLRDEDGLYHARFPRITPTCSDGMNSLPRPPKLMTRSEDKNSTFIFCENYGRPGQ